MQKQTFGHRKVQCCVSKANPPRNFVRKFEAIMSFKFQKKLRKNELLLRLRRQRKFLDSASAKNMWSLPPRSPNSAFCPPLVCSSVEQIGDFGNPNPVQKFNWIIRSVPNPLDLSKYLIQSGIYPKKISDLSVLLQSPMQLGYPNLIRLSFLEIQSDPDPVLNCRIRLDRDPATGSCSILVCSLH